VVVKDTFPGLTDERWCECREGRRLFQKVAEIIARNIAKREVA
jgi:hypothetical protein